MKTKGAMSKKNIEKIKAFFEKNKVNVDIKPNSKAVK